MAEPANLLADQARDIYRGPSAFTPAAHRCRRGQPPHHSLAVHCAARRSFVERSPDQTRSDGGIALSRVDQQETAHRVHPMRAVSAPRGGMHGTDLIDQPGMADRPLRRRSRSPQVIARIQQHRGAGTRPAPVNPRLPSWLWPRITFCSPRLFQQLTRSFQDRYSCSNSRIRRFAADNSTCSVRVAPCSWPESIKSCLRQT